MRRRDLITLLSGAAAGLPVCARAQQPPMPVIGHLTLGSTLSEVAAFHQALKEAGYIEGRNLRIEFRSANGQAARLPELAAGLVRSQVVLIVAQDGPAIFAAKAATSRIPIVFATGLDPVKFGLVTSLSRPEGNLTGVAFLSSQLL